jgi:thioredoxin-related protein
MKVRTMSMKSILSVLRCFAIVLVVCGFASGAKSTELVMFESATCAWCQRWHEEIGPAYPNTQEAKCAPLRRVDINGPRPEDLSHVASIVFTPTFVLVQDGKEIARLVGYPGEDFFWPLLAQELVKLPQPCPN